MPLAGYEMLSFMVKLFLSQMCAWSGGWWSSAVSRVLGWKMARACGSAEPRRAGQFCRLVSTVAAPDAAPFSHSFTLTRGRKNALNFIVLQATSSSSEVQKGCALAKREFLLQSKRPV